MARHKVKRLPVVDGTGVLHGVVSRSDLLNVFLRENHDIAEEIRREVVGGRFPASPESVRVGVRDGVVTLTGHVPDTSVTPLAVDWSGPRKASWTCAARCRGRRRRPALDPDFADG
ncbi:CBS domain-containing protein [Streptomyces sp. NPDC101219]|uniref:CBS domain-containing protein n=1 Tax=Streptomyces sp. NPDC101219 TaxID=3366131 RepID=UPI00380FFF22